MATSFTYSEMTEQDIEALLPLSLKLWEDAEEAELRIEFQQTLTSSKQKIILAKNSGQTLVGFAFISIRTDHVAGAEQPPTGYLEGIFIEPGYRKKGIAKKLVQLGETWLKKNNCTQMGSDTWLWNKESQEFHEKIGFREEERLVHFIKNIE